MPPDGYTTVTLPEELARELGTIGDGNPANGVRTLLADHDADAETIDARIVDMDASQRRKLAEEVAGVLRE